MDIFEEFLGKIVVGFIIAAALQIYLIRRRINNIADPLLYFALTSAFALGLALPFTDSVVLYLRIVGYFCCLYIGFFVALGKPKIYVKPLVMRVGMRQFKLVIVIGSVVFLLSNLFLWGSTGIIILSENPSLLKSTSYTGGYGFVRRINWGIGSFVLIATTYWYLWERSKNSIFWLGMAIVINISGGSKGALLPAIFALGLYYLNPFQPASLRINPPSFKIIYKLALVALIPVSVVLLTEQGSLGSAFNAFLQRLLSYGDVLLYWGQPDLRQHFMKLGVIDYFRDSFGSILGALRLINYQAPIGNQFVQFTLPVGSYLPDSLGPNLPFYVRGELYFGVYFAPVHALVVGWVFGRLRRVFICYRGGSLLRYTLAVFAVYLSSTLPVDEGLAIGRAVDFLMVYFFVYVLGVLIDVAATSENDLSVNRDN